MDERTEPHRGRQRALPRKVDALAEHASQLAEGIAFFEEFLAEDAVKAGEKIGVTHAEEFRVLRPAYLSAQTLTAVDRMTSRKSFSGSGKRSANTAEALARNASQPESPSISRTNRPEANTLIPSMYSSRP